MHKYNINERSKNAQMELYIFGRDNVDIIMYSISMVIECAFLNILQAKNLIIFLLCL